MMALAHLNAANPAAARHDLLACCDVPTWADTILAGRPYDDVAALLAVADAAARGFGPSDVAGALARHPRIGERATGADTESRWSRQEQAGVTESDDTRAALAEGNRAYEARFGRVFLICATGLAAEQVLAELHRRLHHDDATETATVAEELRKIALLRLRKLVGEEVPA